jgi:hypothetical protein
MGQDGARTGSVLGQTPSDTKETTMMRGTISRSSFGRLLLGALTAAVVTVGAVATLPSETEAVYKRRACQRLWNGMEMAAQQASYAEQQWWNAPDGSEEEPFWRKEADFFWALHEKARDDYLAADC